jgi:hypothetical protein
MNTAKNLEDSGIRDVPSRRSPRAPKAVTAPVVVPRAPRAPRTHKSLTVVNQIREAAKGKNRLAAVIGVLLGGFVPLATYIVAHYELKAAEGVFQIPALLVLGGLVFSAKTVFDWTNAAFGLKVKALGFVVLAEGVMVTAHTEWLCIASLCYLIGINAVATGSRLALQRNK